MSAIEVVRNELEFAVSALREMRLDRARLVEQPDGSHKVDGVAAKGVRLGLQVLKHPRIQRYL